MSEQLEIVIGCAADQESSIMRTIPCLGAAVLYAENITVITKEDDTLIELISTEGREFYDQPWFKNFGVDQYEKYDKLSMVRNISHNRFVDLMNRGFTEDEIAHDHILKKLDAVEEKTEIENICSVFEEYIDSPEKLPLLYDPHGQIGRYDIEVGSINNNRRRKAHIATQLGVGLQQQLPSFEGLNPSQILILREETKDYLDAFRSYMLRLSEGLDEVGEDADAWGDLIWQVYRGEVLPLLDELRSAFDANNIKSILKNDFREDPIKLLRSSLSIGVGYFAEFPITASVVGAVFGAEIAARYARVKTTNEKLKKDKLYFLEHIRDFRE